VLAARVLRTEASGAAALAFGELSPSQRAALDKILAELDGGEEATLVSELLEAP
jgi:GTP-sensing pleiotropic transcriptional regulator CodY